MFPSCLESLQSDVCSMKGVGLIQVWKLHFTSGSRRVFVRGSRDPRGSESTHSLGTLPQD